MLQPLIGRLSEGADSSDIQRFLDEEITGHFGMSAGPASKPGSWTYKN